MDEIPKHIIDALRTDIRKEMSKRLAGWAVAGGAGIVGLAALGAWGLLKDPIADGLGVQSPADIRALIAEEMPVNAVPVLSETQIRQIAAVMASDHVDAFKGDPGTNLQFPDGAVVAFDGGDYEKTGRKIDAGCPAGWIRFEQADGRFILGSDSYPSFETADGPVYKLRREDGVESVTLTPEQMVPHTHNVHDEGHQHNVERDEITGGAGGRLTQEVRGNRVDRPYKTGASRARITESPFGGLNGRAQPINNMPPYIALYFCKQANQ